jgi:hypothetical protein
MKKIIGFFAGISIIALVVAAVLAASRLYDAAESSRVRAALMQPGGGRAGQPIPLANLSHDYVRDHLIAFYAGEYLRVLPIEGEAASRVESRAALRAMSNADAIAAWKRDVLPDLVRMSGEGNRREIIADPEKISQKGDYFAVPLLMKTWDHPNDLNAAPAMSSGGELYLKILFNKRVRDTMNGGRFDAAAAMERGMPPELIFEFMVVEAVVR